MGNRKEFLKIKNIKQLEQKISKDVQNIVNKQDLAKDVAEIIVDDIRKDTKYAAKEATKRIRSELEKLNSTHPDYQRSKINFTFTGELLNDLIKNVKKYKSGTRKTVIDLQHSPKKHKPYKKSGKRNVRSSKVGRLSYRAIYDKLVSINDKYAYLNKKIKKKSAKKIVKLIKSRIINFYRNG